MTPGPETSTIPALLLLPGEPADAGEPWRPVPAPEVQNDPAPVSQRVLVAEDDDTANVILRQGIVPDKVTLLSKPFTADALADALRKALDRTGQRG